MPAVVAADSRSAEQRLIRAKWVVTFHRKAFQTRCKPRYGLQRQFRTGGTVSAP